MAASALTRADIAVALGGGVTGDLTGFAAACYERGIPFVQIPTTLLSMVDASVGGKTAVDLPEGKNLAGAFHQPSMVIEDTDCLTTLSPETFTEGMAEVIKYAFIMDPELYEMLSEIAAQGKALDLQDDIDTVTKILRCCVKDKADVIAQDEHDNGRRQILNYGHTIGHVIERNSNFTLAHGVCVAKGMGIIADACFKAGLTSEETAGSIKSLIRAYGLPAEDDITAEEAVSGAMNDKKKRGETISVILVNEIGKAEIKKMSPEEFTEFLR